VDSSLQFQVQYNCFLSCIRRNVVVHTCNSQGVCLLSLLEPVSVDSEVKVATAILVSL
jgi:hypothetical protein